jgi:serine/threonine-protein kinase RsbW
MSVTHDIEIRIQSQPRYLCVVRAAVEAAMGRLGINPDEITPIVLGVDEAMTNIVRHGYECAEDRPIWVKLSPYANGARKGVEIVIEDESDTDPESIKPMPEDPESPGGLGVCIIERTMDEVEFKRREDNRGLRLRMVKYNAAQPDPQ